MEWEGWRKGAWSAGASCSVRGVPSVRSKLRAEGYPRAHLENGILHIANLYAGVVICWLAGEEGLEPE